MRLGKKRAGKNVESEENEVICFLGFSGEVCLEAEADHLIGGGGATLAPHDDSDTVPLLLGGGCVGGGERREREGEARV